MAEYMNYFGQGPEEKFILSIKKSNSTITDCLFTYEKEYTKTDTTTTKYIFTAQRKEKKRFTLYYQMLMFFANGGGTCYVLSAGNYKDNQLLNKNMMSNAINALEKEREITMVVIPEAVHSPDCANIQTMVLDHCSKMQNRFAILDVQAKSSENQTMMEQVKEFQTNIGNNGLSYGAAYYPWLETTILGDKDITPDMFSWSADSELDFKAFFPKDSGILNYTNATIDEIIKNQETPDNKKNEFHQVLLQNWSIYQSMIKTVKASLNLLPPSAAMVGIYTMVDNTRGVWKAPANVSVNYVNRPEVNINNREQEDLNVPVNVKAINAIRSFIGEGIKIWGARTLDSNSLDWRYINVRRSMIFLEESVKNAVHAYVFEPNDAKCRRAS